MTVRAPTFENDVSPQVEQVGTNDWELHEPFEYVWEDGGAYYRVVVPEGYSFEPSINRVVWPAVSPLEALIASAPHDYMYGERPDVMVERWVLEGRWEPHHVPTRKEADQVFLQVMAEQGHAWWRRGLAYLFVRAFGWLWWDDIIS